MEPGALRSTHRQILW